ncbi:hypothetical protein FH609_015835 [Streptomyces sp. 3MP-14]|uniref:Uncharacterized protein n=1 Tax=Streptomyces mimosae TaxID=2586635 RepID=A0A5N6AAL4_9ACTN|nr:MULTISPECIES: hypothetical protein [Streptomyces]KAB8165864.1 hypothetical protein FH607_013160 [Streptomyces mimosae]KAB8176253.1 hypothetical protein FH609_015835 [Streptomyces sp. 3MP-14]
MMEYELHRQRAAELERAARRHRQAARLPRRAARSDRRAWRLWRLRARRTPRGTTPGWTTAS